jgi:uncharacterized lipoprotein YajG
VNPFHHEETGVVSACSGAAVSSAATTAVVVEIFIEHPDQRAEQMEIEYSAEAEAIFVSGHASLRRRFQKTLNKDFDAGFWRFQAEIARAGQNLNIRQH